MPDNPDPHKSTEPAAAQAPAAVFFDVDGTIARTDIVMYYVYFATRDRSRLRRVVWLAIFCSKLLPYLLIDKFNRSQFNRIFYRNYRNMDMTRLRTHSHEHFKSVIRPRIFPEAQTCIETHKARNELIVLVTGSLDFIMEPLAEFLGADAVIAAGLVQREKRSTGELTGIPIGDEHKASVVQAFAGERGIDLSRCSAYGDSSSDLAFLRTVGHPTAVNPDSTLRRIAESEGWPVKTWNLSAAHGSLSFLQSIIRG